ncbi:MAG: ribokinase [Pseudomonadota bacterium]
MIVVFGSINMDLVFPLHALPRPGETVLGQSYALVPGGKGANQAVAAARDGAHVSMVACVGDDAFGRLALASLAAAGVDIAGVVSGPEPTGCAAVCVDEAGRNLIAVAQGANLRAAAARIPDSLLGPATTVVLQMEVPPVETAALIARAKAKGARIVLNLAPAVGLDEAALGAVDVLVMNEIETAALVGWRGLRADRPAPLARRLSAGLGGTVVVTLGAEGALAVHGGETWAVAALEVEAVDTTAAGDAFVGILAAALDRGRSLPEALHRASVGAGLACLTRGAQPSLPAGAAIDARLRDLGPARKIPG